ncbi:Fpg/Nei family DNA glycosylase [Myceligenerans crystallogenes]|uniref:DNA-(apurinic or apyrimidinic site) lyase n=1 Tax=Myceligenerans crystallogenes TaxID=316335 RepID=A0ABN2N6E3_9MICO
MPEGHTVHRLARTLRDLFEGEPLRVTSPQGRFADGAALLTGRRLVEVEAWGKQLFCAFVPDDGAGSAGGSALRTEALRTGASCRDASPTPASRASGSAGSPRPADSPGSDDVLWLRTHLGLYGAWTFAGDGTAEVAHAIGAPRKRIGERESILAPAADPAGPTAPAQETPSTGKETSAREGASTREAGAERAASPRVAGPAQAATSADVVGPVRAAVSAQRIGLAQAAASAPGSALDPGGVPSAGRESEPPAPRGQVRARLVGAHAVADLTGPAACEVITPDEKDAVTGRLGPDPIRDGEPGHDAARFVTKVGGSRVTIGQLLMDQAVIAGVGNIYRAEALFRAGVDPLKPGRDVPPSSARAIWDDLVTLMRDGARTGAIVTTRPEDRSGHRSGEPNEDRRRTRQNTDGTPGAVPSDQAFYVYHRDGLPCRTCATPVLLKTLAGRNLFWCGTCQT